MSESSINLSSSSVSIRADKIVAATPFDQHAKSDRSLDLSTSTAASSMPNSPSASPVRAGQIAAGVAAVGRSVGRGVSPPSSPKAQQRPPQNGTRQEQAALGGDTDDNHYGSDREGSGESSSSPVVSSSLATISLGGDTPSAATASLSLSRAASRQPSPFPHQHNPPISAVGAGGVGSTRSSFVFTPTSNAANNPLNSNSSNNNAADGAVTQQQQSSIPNPPLRPPSANTMRAAAARLPRPPSAAGRGGSAASPPNGKPPTATAGAKLADTEERATTIQLRPATAAPNHNINQKSTIGGGGGSEEEQRRVHDDDDEDAEGHHEEKEVAANPSASPNALKPARKDEGEKENTTESVGHLEERPASQQQRSPPQTPPMKAQPNPPPQTPSYLQQTLPSSSSVSSPSASAANPKPVSGTVVASSGGNVDNNGGAAKTSSNGGGNNNNTAAAETDLDEPLTSFNWSSLMSTIPDTTTSQDVSASSRTPPRQVSPITATNPKGKDGEGEGEVGEAVAAQGKDGRRSISASQLRRAAKRGSAVSDQELPSSFNTSMFTGFDDDDVTAQSASVSPATSFFNNKKEKSSGGAHQNTTAEARTGEEAAKTTNRNANNNKNVSSVSVDQPASGKHPFSGSSAAADGDDEDEDGTDVSFSSLASSSSASHQSAAATAANGFASASLEHLPPPPSQATRPGTAKPLPPPSSSSAATYATPTTNDDAAAARTAPSSSHHPAAVGERIVALGRGYAQNNAINNSHDENNTSDERTAHPHDDDDDDDNGDDGEDDGSGGVKRRRHTKRPSITMTDNGTATTSHGRRQNFNNNATAATADDGDTSSLFSNATNTAADMISVISVNGGGGGGNASSSVSRSPSHSPSAANNSNYVNNFISRAGVMASGSAGGGKTMMALSPIASPHGGNRGSGGGPLLPPPPASASSLFADNTTGSEFSMAAEDEDDTMSAISGGHNTNSNNRATRDPQHQHHREGSLKSSAIVSQQNTIAVANSSSSAQQRERSPSGGSLSFAVSEDNTSHGTPAGAGSALLLSTSTTAAAQQPFVGKPPIHPPIPRAPTTPNPNPLTAPNNVKTTSQQPQHSTANTSTTSFDNSSLSSSAPPTSRQTMIHLPTISAVGGANLTHQAAATSRKGAAPIDEDAEVSLSDDDNDRHAAAGATHDTNNKSKAIGATIAMQGTTAVSALLLASSHLTAEEFMRVQNMFQEFKFGLQEGEATERTAIEKESEKSLERHVMKPFNNEKKAIEAMLEARALALAEQQWRAATDITDAIAREDLLKAFISDVYEPLKIEEDEAFYAVLSDAGAELVDYFSRKAIEDDEASVRTATLSQPEAIAFDEMMKRFARGKLCILCGAIEAEEEKTREALLTTPEADASKTLFERAEKRLNHIVERSKFWATKNAKISHDAYFTDLHQTQRIDFVDLREPKARTMIQQAERLERHSIRRDFQNFVTARRIEEEDRQHQRDLFAIQTQYIKEEIDTLFSEEVAARQTVLEAESLVFKAKQFTYLKENAAEKVKECLSTESSQRFALCVREYAFGKEKVSEEGGVGGTGGEEGPFVVGVYQRWLALQAAVFADYLANLKEVMDSTTFILRHFERAFAELVNLEMLQRRVIAVSENCQRCEDFCVVPPILLSSDDTISRGGSESHLNGVDRDEAANKDEEEFAFAKSYVTAKAIALFETDETIYRRRIEKSALVHSCWPLQTAAKRLHAMAETERREREAFIKNYAKRLAVVAGEEEEEEEASKSAKETSSQQALPPSASSLPARACETTTITTAVAEDIARAAQRATSRFLSPAPPSQVGMKAINKAGMSTSVANRGTNTCLRHNAASHHTTEDDYDDETNPYDRIHTVPGEQMRTTTESAKTGGGNLRSTNKRDAGGGIVTQMTSASSSMAQFLLLPLRARIAITEEDESLSREQLTAECARVLKKMQNTFAAIKALIELDDAEPLAERERRRLFGNGNQMAMAKNNNERDSNGSGEEAAGDEEGKMSDLSATEEDENRHRRQQFSAPLVKRPIASLLPNPRFKRLSSQ